MSTDKILPADQLRDYARRILEAAGVAPHRASLVADVLLFANLRGVDSHGVQLLPYYIEQLAARDVDHAAGGRVVSESGSSMVYDGCNGLGAVISDICCQHVNRLAKEHGTGMVVARESNHFGAAAFWALKMSAEGNIGIVMCNASPMVAPWQGREPRFGTNPICMSVPGPYESTWLLDMATTTVAAGKIYKAWFNKQPAIPAGWALMRRDGQQPIPTRHLRGR
jgi:LDH2 family malate/lactate/ureidoglycolate dehydrogenase